MSDKLNNLYSVLTRSELWATVAVILGAVYQANVLPESWAKIAALALAILAALGYGIERTIKKIAVAKADAVAVAASAVNPTRAP